MNRLISIGAQRWVEPDGSSRRWWYGAGGEAPDGAARLLRHGAARGLCQWKSAGRAAGPGLDQVSAEALLWALLEAGMVAIHERRNRRGDWEPYQWRVLEPAKAVLGRTVDLVDPGPYLEAEEPFEHPVLASIRSWLSSSQVQSQPVVARLAMAIGESLRRGAPPRGRVLSLEVGGHTKAIRLLDHREALEEVLGSPLEEVVRLHGRAVLAFGPFSFDVQGRRIDGDWSIPWLALTPETLRFMNGLETRADRLLTIENLVSFEEDVRVGLPADTVALFTGGFPGGLEKQFMLALIEAGIRRVDHWGDLDLGGIRILEHLAELLPVPVAPFRMEAELLERLPGQELSERDRAGLEAYLAACGKPHEPSLLPPPLLGGGRSRSDREGASAEFSRKQEAPRCAELARAMLRLNRKVEQEAWLVGGAGG